MVRTVTKVRSEDALDSSRDAIQFSALARLCPADRRLDHKMERFFRRSASKRRRTTAVVSALILSDHKKRILLPTVELEHGRDGRCRRVAEPRLVSAVYAKIWSVQNSSTRFAPRVPNFLIFFQGTANTSHP